MSLKDHPHALSLSQRSESSCSLQSRGMLLNVKNEWILRGSKDYHKDYTLMLSSWYCPLKDKLNVFLERTLWMVRIIFMNCNVH